MGQEASLPHGAETGDESLEEMARAPPSAVQPSHPATPASSTQTTGRGGRKLMNAMFRGGNHGDGASNGRHNDQHHGAQGESPVHQPEQLHLPEVGVMYEKPPSRKMFQSGKGPSARGAAFINSVRNLSLGGALRPGKQPKQNSSTPVNDWEKQWDEDEDSSDEGDEDEAGPLHSKGPVRAESSQVPPSAEFVASIPTSSQPENDSHAEQMQSQLHERKLDESANDLEWDTGTGVVQSEEKTDVQMFMPMLRVLGKGSFGKVVLVQKRVGRERGGLFAMKILKKAHLVKRRQVERTRTERKVLSLVNHPFIMKLHFAFQTDEKLYFVLDYCPGGELFFHLSRYRRFPERVARFFSAELLLAIGHLHKRGIIYRDLKPENVLLDADGHVKLGDFGLAKAGILHPLEGAVSMCGTPEYMAPEVLAQVGHGFCVDYWGLGMIVYEMMTGLPPWYTTDRAKLFRKLKSAPLDIPSYFNASAASCVSALLERDPRRRLGVTGIRTAMEHDFFRNINWRALYSRKLEPPIRPCEGWKSPETIRDENTNVPTSANDIASVVEMNSKDLDVAVQNFDNQFTRMPLESEDQTVQHRAEEAAALSELNADTFRGFSFDGKESPATNGVPVNGIGPDNQQKLPAEPRSLD